ncbi:MAG TPA: diguanylate cyclase [Actinomycetota bacterium]|nr:diguanylate cyclase [Actinomycetota bacterium]
MPERMTYLQARLLLLALGVAVSVSQAVLAHQRGAAPIEVLAPTLYVPVFVGAIIWSVPGGLAAAALSSAVYVSLLADEVSAIGFGHFTLLAATRVATYVFLGVVIAAGTRYIENRLQKLEIYDQVDDLTGLGNPSFFLRDTDLEVGRADRYRTLFSVVTLDVPRTLFAGTSHRRYRRTIEDLARRMEAAVRTVDRVARVAEPSRDRFLFVLPETAEQGARVFAERLQASVGETLRARDLPTEQVEVAWLTYPGDPSSLERLRDEVAVVDASRRAVADRRV